VRFFNVSQEDPFLLLESSLKAIKRILLLRRGLPLRRTWIEQPYGEEEITLLEEEVIPAIQQQQQQRCQLEAERRALGAIQRSFLPRCRAPLGCWRAWRSMRT
jgi:hypothetical protein